MEEKQKQREYIYRVGIDIERKHMEKKYIQKKDIYAEGTYMKREHI